MREPIKFTVSLLLKRYKCRLQSQFTYSHTEFNMSTQCSSTKHADQGGCPTLEEHPGQEVVFFGCRLLTRTLYEPPLILHWGGPTHRPAAGKPFPVPGLVVATTKSLQLTPHPPSLQTDLTLNTLAPPFLSTFRADSCTMSNIWFSFTPKNQNNTRRRRG